MIMTTREAWTEIERAVRTGEVISDDVAQTIAAGLISSATRDIDIVLCANGKQFDGMALFERVNDLITREFAGTDVLPELYALRGWVLARLPHLVVTTFEITSQQWSAWIGDDSGDNPGQYAEYADSGSDDAPEGFEGSEDIALIDEWRRTLGEFFDADDEDMPTDTTGMIVEHDGTVIKPASVVEATVEMLKGAGHQFWAQSYGANPFGPGLYWETADTFDDLGPGKLYASRYEAPAGWVEIKTCRVVGLTPEQEKEVWTEWTQR